jgi:hypothetical protein
LENHPPTPPSSEPSNNWIYFAALILALLAFGFGSYLAGHNQGFALLSAGIVSVMAVLVTWPLAASMSARNRATNIERAEMSRTLTDRLHQIAGLLTTLSEHQLLSDRAKSVAFREKDRQALRSAIREEMNAKDWDAALVLANEMETQFGYTKEAGILRSEINQNRAEVIQRQIGEAAGTIEDHCRAERWTHAMREAERIMQIYPNQEQAKQLPQEIENRRQSHKRQLLDSWKDSVGRNDIDGSIEILKRVDPYLTPAEAASMQEAARGIFKERLNNLKDRFSKAVHDENWNDALRIGDLIMHDHPNSRLALEVRDTMETLRQRASGHAGVA